MLCLLMCTWLHQASLQALHTNILKQIIQIKHNRLKIPTGRRQTSCLFTSVDEELNSGLP